ncbi:hypothetical protein JZ751_008487 [Albula glossodonta]|uniref:Ig-like domain-containing protein n=1 Tax=Albula glossodonta TaxID=121402 RepID=A0A8T2MTL8_9TELE|nr:hypothetical protein JZ751_008487 [Albula glossodonta]
MCPAAGGLAELCRVVITQPAELSASVGADSVVLPCSLQHSCPNTTATVRWLRFYHSSHQQLSDHPPKYNLQDQTLTIQSPLANDSGIYYCAIDLTASQQQGAPSIGSGTLLVVTVTPLPNPFLHLIYRAGRGEASAAETPASQSALTSNHEVQVTDPPFLDMSAVSTDRSQLVLKKTLLWSLFSILALYSSLILILLICKKAGCESCLYRVKRSSSRTVRSFSQLHLFNPAEYLLNISAPSCVRLCEISHCCVGNGSTRRLRFHAVVQELYRKRNLHRVSQRTSSPHTHQREVENPHSHSPDEDVYQNM